MSTMNAVTSSNPPPVQSLKRLAIQGSIWTVATQVGGNAMRLVGNLILTRMLFPEAFGLMVLVGVFTAGLQMFSDFGISQNVIHSERGDDPVFLRTAWTLAVLRGGVLWLLSCLLTWPYAQWYGEPQLMTLLPVISFCAVINGLQSIRLATRNRHLVLGAFSLIHLGSQLASLVVTVVWALIHPSVWALVAGGVALSVTRTVLSHLVLKGPRDKFGWDSAAAVAMYRFGKWIFISTILTFCARQADKIILSKLISREMLGVYGIALIWALVPSELLQRVAQQVAFPVFSKLKTSDGGLLGPQAARVRRPLSILGGMIVTFLLVSGQDLINLLYDPRYEQAGLMLQLMAVGVWFQMQGNSYTPALLALGETRRMALGHAAKFLSLLVGVPLGFHYGGISGVLWGLAAAELAKYSVLGISLHRHGLSQMCEDMKYTLLIGLAMALSLGITWMWPMNPFMTGMIHLLIGIGIWIPFWPVLWEMVQNRKKRALQTEL